MAERRAPAEPGKAEPPKPAPAPPEADTAYTDEEEAEVRKRLEDLGYLE